jgi:hypothetical protein
MEKVGIESIKSQLKFAVSLANGISASMADGKLGLEDMVNFYEVAKNAKPALDSLKMVKAEFKDLDAEERAQLLDYGINELKIISSEVEAVISNAMKLAAQMGEFIDSVKALKK